MRILFYGDSITQGYWGSNGGWVEIIRNFFVTRKLKDLKKIDIPAIFNLGVSADTTRNLLARVENETKARKFRDVPIIAVIAIGTNDDLFESDKQWIPPDEFRKNLEKIVTILQPLTSNIMLIGNPAVDESLTTPVFWGDFNYTNKELERSENIIKEVAEQYNIPYVPIFKAFKQKLDDGGNLLADGLHPNDAGHQFIADQVLPELKKLL